MLAIYPNEDGRDLQLRRISVRNTDAGGALTRIETDNTNRRANQAAGRMSRLVGGEITEVRNNVLAGSD